MASRMSKKSWIIIVVTLIIAVAAIVGIALNRDSPSPSGNEALDFTLPTLTGANITLSELTGTPVVLNFWTTWCRGCLVDLRRLDAVAQQSRGGIKVVAINVGESASRVKSFFGDYEPTMIIALDENRKAFVDYSLAYNNTLRAIPFTLFVDSEGTVQRARIGAFRSEAELWYALRDVFGITIPATS